VPKESPAPGSRRRVEVEVGVDATSRAVEGAAGEPIVRRLVRGAAEDEREARALDSGRVANLREVKADVLGRNVDDVQDGDGRVRAEEAALVGAAQRRKGETIIVTVAVAVAPRVGAPARQELARAVRRGRHGGVSDRAPAVVRDVARHVRLGRGGGVRGQGEDDERRHGGEGKCGPPERSPPPAVRARAGRRAPERAPARDPAPLAVRVQERRQLRGGHRARA